MRITQRLAKSVSDISNLAFRRDPTLFWVFLPSLPKQRWVAKRSVDKKEFKFAVKFYRNEIAKKNCSFIDNIPENLNFLQSFLLIEHRRFGYSVSKPNQLHSSNFFPLWQYFLFFECISSDVLKLNGRSDESPSISDAENFLLFARSVCVCVYLSKTKS